MPAPENGGEWGILGGTFDPVHYGHLSLASAVYSRRNLSGVLLIPSYKHPFKIAHCQASYDDRVAMLRLAAEDSRYLVVNEIEKELGLSGFTVDTVRAVKKKYPAAAFYFIIGADNLTRLREWHRPDLLLKEITILAGARPSFTLSNELNHTQLPVEKIELIESPPVEASSTDLRAMFRAGRPDEDFERLLPPRVRRYIQSRKLYQ
ncbi:MAG: nicotinate (nicotinamide) nucleotide adenylyltransferase [candidate division Zixibacteria bacterium]|nr:nicotinate (nicotinamide) nucleotide adenylyltransferase [candidate division Zixibacteria bacterium]